MKKLPNKMSALICVALKDLSLVERSKKYRVDMNSYHTPDENRTVCSVSLAGSVMAKTLGTPSFFERNPSDFGTDTSNKLDAIDFLSTGRVSTAAELMEQGTRLMDAFQRKIIPYSTLTRSKFKAQMRKLAADLAMAGY